MVRDGGRGGWFCCLEDLERLEKLVAREETRLAVMKEAEVEAGIIVSTGGTAGPGQGPTHVTGD